MPLLTNNNNTNKSKIQLKTVLLELFIFFFMRLNSRSLPMATVSLITIEWVIFAAGLFSNSKAQVITVYRSIPSHLFYNDPDTANGIGFDQQRSLPFFSSEFSLETLARLFSSMFIHVGVFIFHGISLCCSVFGVR